MSRSTWFSYRRSPVSLRSNRNRKLARFVKRPVRRGLQLESLEDRMMLSANVYTDQADYAPGETAHIVATDFAVGEAVEFQVLHTDGTPNTGNGHLPWTVVDGSADDLDGLIDGNIHTTWYVDPDDSGNSAFVLTAAGLTSGESASVNFTDDGNGTPTNITTQPGWLDVNGVNPVTTINAPSGFIITKVAIKSGSGSFAIPSPDNPDAGDDNTSDQHSGVITANGTYGLGNGFTVSGIGTSTVTVTKNSGSKDISHVDYYKQEAPRGSITVVKDAVPDSSQDFEFDPSSNLQSANFLLDDDANNTLSNTKLFSNLAAGTYTVQEISIPLGWNLTNIVVMGAVNSVVQIGSDSDFDAGDSKVSVALAAGENVTIKYTNTKVGSLTVVKDAVPNSSENFTFDPSSNLQSSNFLLDDDSNPPLSNTKVFSNLVPGTYTVQEISIPSGWNVSNIIVSGAVNSVVQIGSDSDFDAGDSLVSVALAAGENVTISYTNSQQGRIIVEKQTNPDNCEDKFEFDPSYGSNFLLSDNGTNNSGYLTPGSYTVEELAKTGWDLSNIQIVSGDNDHRSTISGSKATIDLDAGEVITVRFTNTQRGKIIVEKQTNPDGSVESFEFDPSYGANFNLSDNGTNNSGYLTPGSYTVEELAKAGWDLSNVQIVSGDNDHGSTISGNKATIDLDAGEEITVRFTNTQRGRITVEKQTHPDGSYEQFEFNASNGSSFLLPDGGYAVMGDLVAGSYTVEELAKAGWDLSNIEIVSGDTDGGSTVNGNKTTIDLDPGEDILVRFTNTQRGRIIVEKQTNPDGSLETFEFDPSYGSNFLLADNGTNTSGYLTPGSYTVAELTKAGWNLTNIDIVSGDTDGGSTISGNTATIDLDAGEEITVRFNNRKHCFVILGPDKGNESVPIIKIVDQATGEIYRQFYAFEPSFRGGVRIATGDMTGDGIDEIIVAPGQGRVGEVRVFTQDGVELTQFRVQPYGSSYTGGVEVAVGDVNGDGKADIVTTNSYGRTEVRVFYSSYNSMLPLTDAIADSPNKQFFVYPSSFRGGADVIVADMGKFLNGAVVDATTPDGTAEIIVGNGPGLRSTIYVYDVSGTPTVVDTILPFSNSFKGGITLSAARVNADAIPDLIVAAGIKGGSAVEIWSGITNDSPDVRLAAFTAFGNVSTKNAPVHATGIDITGDEIADVIAVIQGTNGASNQMRYFGTDGTALGTFNGFNGPWNIASSCDLSVTRDYGDTAAADQYFSQLVEEVATATKKAKKKKK